MYVSIDPGKNVGVATFTNEGVDINKKIMIEAEFLNFLQMLMVIKDKPEQFICFIMEDFKLRKDKAIDQVGSDMPAARMVGAVQLADTILGDQSHLVYSKPAELRSSLRWAGMSNLADKPRTWHCPDDIAAYAHGVKYLIDKGLRKHPIFN